MLSSHGKPLRKRHKTTNRRRLWSFLLESPLWDVPDVSRFGIDIFETLTALAKGHKLKQALLGVKNHDAKDPTSQLASMFRQVMNTMFTCIEEYESAWREVKGVTKTEMFGENNYENTPEAIPVSLPATIEAFKSSYDQYVQVYQSFLEKELQNKFTQIRQIQQIERAEIDFSPEIWVKTVYSFIAEFHKKPTYGNEKLIDALRVLWFGRVAVFLKETQEESREEAEERIADEARIFQKLKPYLIEKY
jgi:hypothetical protein